MSMDARYSLGAVNMNRGLWVPAHHIRQLFSFIAEHIGTHTEHPATIASCTSCLSMCLGFTVIAFLICARVNLAAVLKAWLDTSKIGSRPARLDTGRFLTMAMAPSRRGGFESASSLSV